MAKDGIAVYFNEANPLHELTLDQVARIYREKSPTGGTSAERTRKSFCIPGKTTPVPTNFLRNTS